MERGARSCTAVGPGVRSDEPIGSEEEHADEYWRPVGTVGALWRFPVKSMLGEELDQVDVDEGGVVGDRAFALMDVETGKVASAKHPEGVA